LLSRVLKAIRMLFFINARKGVKNYLNHTQMKST